MTWIKIDDALPEHPKVLSAPPMAGWLYVCGICYCNRNLTDGFIPRRAALRLVDAGHDEVISMVAGLVDAGLWAADRDGFQVHDYLGHQRSAAQIKRTREGARARKQLQRSREVVTQLSQESHSGTPQITDGRSVTSAAQRESESKKEREKGIERADAPTVVLELSGRKPVMPEDVVRWHALRDDEGRRVLRDVMIEVELEGMREFLATAPNYKLPKKSLPLFALRWLKNEAKRAAVTRRARNREDRQGEAARAGTEQQLAELVPANSAESLDDARELIRKTFGGTE